MISIIEKIEIKVMSPYWENLELFNSMLKSKYGKIFDIKQSIKEISEGETLLWEVTKTFKYKRYTGPMQGLRTIQRLVFDRSFVGTKEQKDAIKQSIEEVKYLCGAAYRLGCMCCYGDGPDIKVNISPTANNGEEALIQVDFDFKIEDYI